jgi:hypothetical protein
MLKNLKFLACDPYGEEEFGNNALFEILNEYRT